MNDARVPATTPGPACLPSQGPRPYRRPTPVVSVRSGLKGFKMRRSMKRVLWVPAVLLVASSVLAACSSSGNTTSNGSSPAAASGGLKKGLKVFVIPKNLGNPYFTTADSVKAGGALAALVVDVATGTE